MTEVSSFSCLTAIGQTRRLRDLAANALQHYDLQVRRMRLLSHSVNTLFRLDTESGDKWVLRINLPNARSLAEIQAEIDWMAALSSEKHLLLPEPLRARNGVYVVQASAQGVPEARYCTVFRWIPGRLLYSQPTTENLAKLGECAAVLHNHAEQFVLPRSFWLRKGNTVIHVSGTQVLFGPGADSRLTPKQQNMFETVIQEEQVYLSRLYAQEKPPIPLHGDLHQGNVKVYRKRLYVFDFDDSFLGYPVQDISISYYYLQFCPQAQQLWEAYRQGYTRLRAWPDASDALILMLSAGRALDVLNHILKSENPRLFQVASRYIEFTTAYLETASSLGT